MRCKSCAYPLWRLTTRTCPECGAPFKPSDFEFVPNSVRFRCVHCAQEYYGTDEIGLLTPREFECVQCRRPVAMDEMILEPAAGFNDEVRPVVNPWLDPHTKGRFRKWIRTVGMTLGRPAALAGATPPGRGGAALWFALRTNITYSLVGLGVIVALPFLFALLGGVRGGGAFGIGTAVILGAVASFLGFAAALLIALGFWALAAHAILRLTGPVAGDLPRTATCICYASGANVLIAVPCIGAHLSAISWIWPALSAGFMFRETHRVAGWRAFLASFLPPAVGMSLLIGAFMFFAVYSAGRAQSGMQVLTAQAAAASVQSAVAIHSSGKTGFMTAHAGELIVDGVIGVEDFVPYSGMVTALQPVVGGFSLADLESSDPDVQARALAAFKAAVPDDAVAYRLGDFVFVRPPALDGEAPVGLWSYVIMPEGGFDDPLAQVAITDRNGAATITPQDAFEVDRVAQNLLRTGLGLPALPDPATIAHDQTLVTPPPGEP